MTTSEAALTRTVLVHGPLSRSELSTRLGLSLSSLTRLATPLLLSGVLVELDDDARASPGRPAKPLAIARGVGDVIGVKLTADRLYAVRTDIHAEPIGRHERPLTDRSLDAVVDEIVAGVRMLGADGVRGIGIGLGGVVHGGLIHRALFLGWERTDLAARVASRLEVPVTVENDVVALAEAERWFGAGRGAGGFAVITIGAGIGYALVMGDDVVRSSDATVGTAGHLILDPEGPVCPQGHRGCAYVMLSSDAIVARVSAALGRPTTYDRCLSAAADGDPVVVAAIGASADALGVLMALVANLTLQPLIVLAGEGAGLFAVADDRVRTAMAAGRDRDAAPIELRLGAAGFDGWARGAAAVAIQAAMARMVSAR